MATCLKRSVLGAGDRQAAITKAAAAVQAATLQLSQRVQPHAGSPLGAPRSVGAAIPHSQLGGYNPIQDALRNLGNTVGAFARAVNNALDQAAKDAAEAAAIGAAGKVAVRIIYQPYIEPMFIPWPDDELIVATVMCGRAVPTANPTERLLNGSEVDFDFFDNHQLKVNSIDGMTPDSTKMITWCFLYFGV
jgi:hypothetical protein